MRFSVNKISIYGELIVTLGDGETLSTGLLDRAECADMAQQLRDAADDLDPEAG